MTEECGEIVFWTLRKKFVASSDEMPEHSSQVMYYSLAIGHHVGVIDCLNVAFRCPLTEYEDWLALVEEEQARRKMLGVMTFGEIVIDASHTALLTRAFAPLADDATSVWQARSIQFIHLFSLAAWTSRRVSSVASSRSHFLRFWLTLVVCRWLFIRRMVSVPITTSHIMLQLELCW